MFGSIVLLVFGLITFLVVEWDNPETLGPLGVGTR